MRELEFLPSWYRQNRRRKRAVVFHSYLLALLMAGLGTWFGLVQRNVHAAESTLTAIQRQLTQTRADQKVLAQKELLRQQLQTQAELLASLGYPIEMTRLLQTLDSVMPKEMSLREFECKTEEQLRQVSSVAALRSSDKQKLYDRRLKVRLLGVAPSEGDLANFVLGLAGVSFLEQVAVPRSNDVVEDGHVLRQFEVTFSINLNQ